MCEIYFIGKQKGKISEKEIREVGKEAVKSSYFNSDGWGAFNEKKRKIKRGRKFKEEDIEEIVEEFKGSKFIVLHLRKATSGGIGKKQAHPFVYKNKLLVHNGVFYTSGEGVDSKKILEEIGDKKVEEDKDMVESIKEVLEEEGGTYSIFLYDNKNRLYYFRRRADFTFCYIPQKNLILGATKEKRLKNMFIDEKLNFFKSSKYQKIYKKPEERRIYKISRNKIERVGEIEKGIKISHSYSSNYGYKGYKVY